MQRKEARPHVGAEAYNGSTSDEGAYLLAMAASMKADGSGAATVFMVDGEQIMDTRAISELQRLLDSSATQGSYQIGPNEYVVQKLADGRSFVQKNRATQKQRTITTCRIDDQRRGASRPSAQGPPAKTGGPRHSSSVGMRSGAGSSATGTGGSNSWLEGIHAEHGRVFPEACAPPHLHA